MKTIRRVVVSVIMVTVLLSCVIPVHALKLTTDIPYRLLGDVDGDSDVNILDATCIQKRLAALPVDPFYEAAGDADNDGEITILDATCIQKYLASLPCPPGIGEPIT